MGLSVSQKQAIVASGGRRFNPGTGGMSIEPIFIEGYAEFRKALRNMEDPKVLQKVLRVALKTAGEPVVNEVRGMMPHRSGRAAGSVRVTSSGSVLKLQSGGARVPYVPWLEFGGRVGRGKRGRGTAAAAGGAGQGRRTDLLGETKVGTGGNVVRAWQPSGRYMWIAFARSAVRGRFNDALMDAFTSTAREMGLEVSSGG